MLPKVLQKLKRAAPAARRTVQVGWTLEDAKASLIWEEPVPYRRGSPPAAASKSVQFCPAVIDFDARHFVVKCPIDINVRMLLSADKPPALQMIDGLQSTVRGKHLNSMVSIISRAEWRHPERPILQFITPYIFITDDPMWVNQLPPFLDYLDPALPGLLIAGRFPLHIWPRRLMWAFEWHDVSKPLVVKRGAPWFYLRFDTPDPSAHVRMVEAEITPDVQRYIDSINGVTNYVNRTFSLFDRAEKRRPKQLLFPKKANG